MEEEEEEEGEVKQKCVDIKLSLRCKPTGKQLCDVTVYVTVDSPLSAHLSTRSFSAVGKIMSTHTTYTQQCAHRFYSSGDLSYTGLLIQPTTC